MNLNNLLTVQNFWKAQALTTQASRVIPLVIVLLYVFFRFTSKCKVDQGLGIGAWFGVCKVTCPENTVDTAGVCWSRCGDAVNVGALCREKCRDGYVDNSGVCWKRCAKNDKNTGAFCQKGCREGYREDSPGICYKQCKDGDVKVGCCLCRERCPSGWKDVWGVCWKGWSSKTMKTYAKDSYVPKSYPKDNYVPPTKAKTSSIPTDWIPAIKTLIAFSGFLGVYIMYRIGWAIIGKIFFSKS